MWPKTVFIKGIGVQVESWDEFDEIVLRYGGDHINSGDDEPPQVSTKSSGFMSSKLKDRDHVLLAEFVQSGDGVLNSTIGPSLGAQGKGISSALKSWAKRIGLVEGDKMDAFEPFNSYKGRGYRLLDGYLLVAKKLLGNER